MTSSSAMASAGSARSTRRSLCVPRPSPLDGIEPRTGSNRARDDSSQGPPLTVSDARSRGGRCRALQVNFHMIRSDLDTDHLEGREVEQLFQEQMACTCDAAASLGEVYAGGRMSRRFGDASSE